MAGSAPSSNIRDAFEAFAKGAYLDVLVPQSTDFEATSLLRDGSPESLQREPVRKHLFFDELVTIHLILRTSSDDRTLKGLLRQVDVNVAAHLTNAVPEGGGNAATASGKHDLASKMLAQESPLEMVTVGDQNYLVWKTTLHLSRPRVRLQRPAIYFTATVALSSSTLQSLRRQRQDYLPSYEPLPANVLEPLRFDPALSGASVVLSETRITKVAPSQSTGLDSIRPIRGASKRAFHVLPALMIRVRYSPLPDSVIASIHIETSQMADSGITIKAFLFDASLARIEPVNMIDWPKRTYPGDEIVICYKLMPTYDALSKNSATPASLQIQITGEAMLDAYSKTALDVRWQGQVELTDPIPKPPLKWSRPLSTTLSSSKQGSLQPESRPISSDDQSKPAEQDAGILFTFTGPPTTLMNEEFKLNVSVLNKSGRPRRLALISIQLRHAHQHRASVQRLSADTRRANDAVELPPKPPQVIDLNADVRIGPLPSGACYETTMRFRAMTTGVLDLGIVRVVDLDTRQTVDVRELPDVVALEADSET